jgi:hypothetical protein
MLAPRSNSPAASTSLASLVFPTTDSSQQPTNPKTDLAKVSEHFYLKKMPLISSGVQSVIEWLFVVIVNIYTYLHLAQAKRADSGT